MAVTISSMFLSLTMVFFLCMRVLMTDVGTSVQAILNDMAVEKDQYQPYPECNVLILNQEHNYHYEVLESIMAFTPLGRRISRNSIAANTTTLTGSAVVACDHSTMHFTFAIADGHEKDFYRQKSLSWYEYAMNQMKHREYTAMKGESRVLHRVIRTNYTQDFQNETNVPALSTIGFDYQIRASCYCKSQNDIQWLYEDDTHFCIFHERCDEASNSLRATWLHPALEPNFFPSLLPAYPHDRRGTNNSTISTTAIVDKSTHHLCIVGEGKRREYDLIAYYLWKHRNSGSSEKSPSISSGTKLHFHHFGIGNVQKPMKPFSDLMTLHPNPNFTDYQRDLYDTCDAILSLVTKFQHPEYFSSTPASPSSRRRRQKLQEIENAPKSNNALMKLSGGIVQAAVYRKPILLHHELALMYKEYLGNSTSSSAMLIETHGDDADSFANAFQQFIFRLDIMKATGQLQSQN